MIQGLQVIGLFFWIGILYLTFLYYKKNAYDGKGFALWSFIWLVMILLVSFPTTFYGIMETLEIKRTVDFLVIGAFLFFSVLIFYLYVKNKINEQKIEEIVRKVAITKARF